MPALILLSAVALAADPVVVAPGVGDGLERVSASADRPADELEAVPLGEVLTGPPRFDGPGPELVGCAGEVLHLEAVTEAKHKIESAIDYTDFPRASERLEEVLGALPCLVDPVPTELIAALYFLEGLVAWESGDEDAALASYRQAHARHPGLAWDDHYAPESRHLFARAAEPTGREHHIVVVGAPSGGVWLDGGTEPERALPPGRHLLQWGSERSVTSAALELEADGASRLVVPTASTEALTWLGTPDQRVLSELLVEHFGSVAPVYAATAGDTWRGDPSVDSWTRLVLPDPPPPPRPLRTAGLWTGAVGAAVLLGGGVATAITWQKARGIYDDGVAPDVTWSQYQEAREAYVPARQALSAARFVTLTGGAVGAVGFGLALGASR